ncbi:MAG UNVERIFIED_CONTAM: lytic murein transglycosylase, partial [Thermobifida fusca]
MVAETLSKVRTDTPPASPAPKPGMSGGWRALGVAGAAIAAVVGVTGGILGIVAFTAESSAPQLLPPGPHELGGRVETLTETNASTAEAEGVPGSRPLPSDQHAALPEIDPAWL